MLLGHKLFHLGRQTSPSKASVQLLLQSFEHAGTPVIIRVVVFDAGWVILGALVDVDDSGVDQAGLALDYLADAVQVCGFVRLV